MNKKLMIIIAVVFSFFTLTISASPIVMNDEFSSENASLSGAGVSKNYKSANGMLANPASMSESGRELQVGWSGMPQEEIGLNYGYILFCVRADSIFRLNGNFGIGIFFLDIGGDMSIYDEIGNQTGSIKNNDYLFNISYAGKFMYNLKYGITVKYFYSSLGDTTTSGVFFDLGGLYLISIPFFNNIRVPKYNSAIGIKIKNVGFYNKGYIGDNSVSPVKVDLGFNYKWYWVEDKLFGLYIKVSYQNLEYSGSEYFTEGFGMEFELSKIFVLRCGYRIDNKYSDSGLTGGIGIKYYKNRYRFNFNYGIKFNKFANTHLINFNFGF